MIFYPIFNALLTKYINTFFSHKTMDKKVAEGIA